MTQANFLVPALPVSPTVVIGPGDRAIGRLTKLGLTTKPEGNAHADLAGDVFYELYQRSPIPVSEIPPDRAVNRALIEWLQETHGYAEGRETTTNNLPASMIAANLVHSHLSNDEVMKKALHKQEAANHARKKADLLERTAELMEIAAEAATSEKEKKESQSHADGLKRKAKQSHAAYERHSAEALEMVAKARKNPLNKAAVAHIAAEAAKTAKEINAAIGGWGMGAGSILHHDPKAALEFLKRNNGLLKDIAILAGQLRGITMSTKSAKPYTGHVPNVVDMTKDLTNIFQSELVTLSSLAPPVLRAKTIGDWLDGGLLGFVPQNLGVKRGLFIGAVDVSPSMRGQRNIVAKAVALAAAQTARADGRKYLLFTFGSNKKQITVVTDSDSWQKHIEWAYDMQNGGTDFNMALDFLMLYMKKHFPNNADKVDALFISDGDAGISQPKAMEWNSFKHTHGYRMFYVPVNTKKGSQPHGYGTGYHRIETVADVIVNVKQLDKAAGSQLAQRLGGWL